MGNLTPTEVVVIGSSAVTLLVTACTAVVRLLRARVTVRELNRQLRQRAFVLGVVGDVPIDYIQLVAPLMDITQIEDIAKYPSKHGYLLHCRRLSYALKNCNFVIGDADDVKVIKNKAQLEAVLEGVSHAV